MQYDDRWFGGAELIGGIGGQHGLMAATKADPAHFLAFGIALNQDGTIFLRVLYVLRRIEFDQVDINVFVHA